MHELYSQPALKVIELLGNSLICVSNGGLEPTGDNINDL